MKNGLKTAKVVFRNGVFVPVEDVRLPEGSEAIVVFGVLQEKERPLWWNAVAGGEKWKNALNDLISEIKKIVLPEELKLIERDGEREIIVVLSGEETAFLKPLMEAGYRTYQTTGIFFPIQVISHRRLQRWKDYDKEIFRLIEEGISLL
ncbi:antitoxin AF2212-like protein [Desulfurobacterium sp.]